MKFPKMNAIFFQWINIKKRLGDDESYRGTKPEEADREFLIKFIQSFHPNFTDDEWLTFDDLVLKSKSLIIHAEVEYPHTAPYDGHIWWKFRNLNLSEPNTEFEFDWMHEFPITYIDDVEPSDGHSDFNKSDLKSELGSERKSDPDSDEDDDEPSDSDSDYDYPISTQRDMVRHAYFLHVGDTLKYIRNLKSENKEHEKKFGKILREILDDKPYIEMFLSRRMKGDPDREQIIQDLNGSPRGPILEFRERLRYAQMMINHHFDDLDLYE